jgi:PAS domain S-box-containing protein
MRNSKPAGAGPALAAAILATGAAGFHAWIQYGVFVIGAGIVGICLWQLRLAKEKAAKGEAWQRRLVETAGEGIWVVDPDGVIGYANARIAEILGCRVEQIEGRKFEAFLFPDDVPVERIRFKNRRAGVKEQYDRRLRRADGSEVWTLACSGTSSHDGKHASVLTMMTDITERKSAEQALRRSERKFRELFENIREGVYQTSPDGRILAANPELLRMLGFSNHEELNVAGVVQDTFVDPDLHQTLRRRLERDGSYANVEFQLRARDRRIVTVRENARVVRDENGGVLYYEGTLTDITEKMRIGKQLRQAQQMEALGRLADGMARDFRAIGVDVIVRLRRVLDSLPPDSPARPRLDAVARSMQSGAALTRQILDFSQRQMDPDAGPIDLNALILRLEPELSHVALSLSVSLCDVPAPVLADPGHLRQVITAFVAYAREFGSGIGKIELSTTIESNGPAETAGLVVSLSVRSSSVRSSEVEDGDLEEEWRPWVGLATTQAILAQYGGAMTAAAEPSTEETGRGVRYSLYLPLASEASLAQPLAGLDNAAVLLVEQEPLMRELSRDMLERQGFHVLTAGNTVEGEQIARSGESFDLLITSCPADGEQANALVHRFRDLRPALRVLFVAG